MSQLRSRSRISWVRAVARWAQLGLVSLAVAACGGGGGGGGDDVAPPPPAAGGTGTGADGVPIFWTAYDTNVAVGAGNAVQQTSDGGYIVAGSQATSFGATSDFFVMKTSNSGVRQWSRRISWAGGGIAYAVKQASDGSYMVAGIGGSGTGATVVLIKLDASGTTVAGWPKTYGPTGGKGAYGLLPINSGMDGYLVVGYADSGQGDANVYVLRIDAVGAMLWQKFDYASFCPAGGEVANALASTGDGNYVVAGRTGCLAWAGFMLKINGTTGAEIWRKTFDGPTEATYTDLYSVAATADGGLVAAGSTGTDCGSSVGGTCDAMVVKTDGSGNELWRRTYGGAEKDGGYGVALTADGSYLAAGYTRSYGGTISDPSLAFQWSDAMLMKVTPAGATVWHKVKGLRPMGAEFVSAIYTAADGGIAMTGSSGGNVFLAKFDKNGDTVNLGASYDLTITLPTTIGIIGFSNAVDIAGLGANGLITPRLLGSELLGRLIASSDGAAPASYCTAGGTYTFNPAVPAMLATGSYTVTFTNCAFGSSTDQVRINGSAVMSVDSGNRAQNASTYTLQVTVASLALVVDEPGTTPLLAQNFAGGLRIARVATGGSFVEALTSPTGVTLAASESSGGTTLHSSAFGSMNMHYTIPGSGPLSVGQAGDVVTATSGANTFAISVLQPLVMTNTLDQPTAGSYRVVAQDSSRLTATLTSNGTESSTALEVDADGDGSDDGTISVLWDFIY
jgi:hypothetical protein